MVFIIGEIGLNHNGDINIAKELINCAVDAQCDAVKFQKRVIEKAYSKEILDSLRESPWGTTVREEKLHLEFGKKEYDIIDEYCKSKNIEWFASSWDVESQLFLRQYDLKYNKIASAMIVHSELLNTVTEEKKHTFISTGMSTIDQIRKAVEIFRKNNCSFELMHSNSSYPMKIEEANLRCIETLKNEFNCNVGYSGHETTGYNISLAASALGASSIERHITLDHSMYGPDHSASLEISGLKRLVKDIRIVEQAMGDGVKRIWDSEIPKMKRLRSMIQN